MAFDARSRALRAAAGPQNIAVIGSGVAGLSAAWLLSERHQVTLFERAARLGGHANTVSVTGADGVVTPVDAGFIVFNRANYPNFTALMAALETPIDESCMSFAVSMNEGRVEYAGHSLSSVFARRSAVLSPSHWAMLRDVPRFHAAAKAALAANIADGVSVADFVATKKFSTSFIDHFLKPFAAAIWSTPSANVLDYPAASLFRFFQNHGLLQVLDMPMWNTVKGGAQRYVEKITAPFADHIRLSSAVRSIRRENGKVYLSFDHAETAQFDAVVIATHADEALAMLDVPTTEEQKLLGAFQYQPNRAVVHKDAALMPRRRRAWASWNYLGGAPSTPGAAITYWMNRLQNLDGDDVFVTLNPYTPIHPEKIVAEFDYTHPTFNVAAGRAQKEFWRLQGVGNVWYCGAHFGQGFHEDGLQAGLAVAEALGGVRRPWAVPDESGRIFLPPSAVDAA